jgi:hypothetical protein
MEMETHRGKVVERPSSQTNTKNNSTYVPSLPMSPPGAALGRPVGGELISAEDPSSKHPSPRERKAGSNTKREASQVESGHKWFMIINT